MIPAKRRALILEHLRREGAAGIQELAEAIGASLSTVRRDLEHLVKQGALERTHGGALLQGTERATFEPDVALAAHLLRDEKNAVADGRLPLTAVTNSLAIAQALADVPEVYLIVPGGTVRPGSTTLVGRPGEDFLRSIHADIALLGSHAITGRTLTETSLDVAAMKQAMIAAARHVIVLTDSSKFTTPSFCTICDVSDIDEIVTDDGIDPEVLEELRRLNVAMRVIPVHRQVGHLG